jgi:hypothetical protein
LIQEVPVQVLTLAGPKAQAVPAPENQVRSTFALERHVLPAVPLGFRHRHLHRGQTDPHRWGFWHGFWIRPRERIRTRAGAQLPIQSGSLDAAASKTGHEESTLLRETYPGVQELGTPHRHSRGARPWFPLRFSQVDGRPLARPAVGPVPDVAELRRARSFVSTTMLLWASNWWHWPISSAPDFPRVDPRFSLHRRFLLRGQPARTTPGGADDMSTLDTIADRFWSKVH